jgi:hypothetical protein
MIRQMLSAFFRRLGLRVSNWLERRLAGWPQRRLRWVLIVLAAMGLAWCGWLLGSALYKLFNHH